MAEGPGLIGLFVPGRLTNPLNGSHRHWSARAKWATWWRMTTAKVVVATRARRHGAWWRVVPPLTQPLVVSFEACVGGRWDDDNLRAALKPVRDELALALGRSDGPTGGITWTYTQRIVPPGDRGVRVTIRTEAL